jgi:hypothetical protein
MKTKANYFKIGLFVLGSVGLLVIGLVAVSADLFVDNVIYMETYINESVQGLSVGSPLMHRGVDIGKIEKLTFVPIEYDMDINSPTFDTFGRYVMVVVAVNRKAVPGLGDNPRMFRRMMENQIKQGLRLKLSYQGITGLLFLQTEYVDPEREPPLKVPWTPRYLYVPWTPSLITSFTQTADRLFQRLENLDLEGVLQKMDAVLGNMNTAVEDVVLGHEEDVDRLLSDLRRLTKNLLDISDTLKNNPSQLLLSTPPKPSEMVP